MSNLKPSSIEKSDATKTKAYAQQILHKEMFLNRPRSNSFNGSTSAESIQTSLQQHTTENTSDSISEQPFTEVYYGKRQRSSPDVGKRTQKQAKLDYWLGAPAVPTTNSFKELEPEISEIQESKPARSPPLFIDGVSNIQPLLKMLEEVALGQYEIKVLRDDRVKIQPKSAESYSTIYKELKNKKTEFYTYQPKQERSFRVVLKHLHSSTDKEDIKIALDELNHKVTNIWNIQNRKTKQPLPIWNIELEPRANNKDIYNVQYLLNCRISFEAPRPNKKIPQCTNCQEYGHTQNFCHRQPRCVKCAGSHHTSKCPRKERSNEVKCVLCNGNHPANYKGCQVYQELQKVKYPTPYTKKNHATDHIKAQRKLINFTPNHGQSYAAVTKGNTHHTKPTIDENTEKQSNADELKVIRETLVTLMNQMLVLTKTITELMSKMPIHSLH